MCNKVVPLIFESLRRLNQGGYNIKLRLGDDGFVLKVGDNMVSMEELREELYKVIAIKQIREIKLTITDTRRYQTP